GSKSICEDNGIFNRLACSHTQIRRHGVRGVSQKNCSSVNPMIDRRSVKDVSAYDVIARGRSKKLLDGWMPSRESHSQIAARIGLVAFSHRSICHRKPIHLIWSDWHNPETLAGSPALGDPVRLGKFGVRGEPAPARLTAVAKRFIATHGASHRG